MKAYTTKEIGKSLKKSTKGEYVLAGDYKGTDNKTLVRHVKCGHVWGTYVRSIITRYRGCPICARHSQARPLKLDNKSFSKKLSEVDPTMKLVGDYTNAKTNVTLMHITCGHSFSISPSNAYRGRGCPRCSKYRLYEIKLGRRIVNVRGYEPQAIRHLIKVEKIKPTIIRVESENCVPTIDYRLDGKARKYKPDILLGEDTLIEVKSTTTAGASKNSFYSRTPAYMFKELKAKARASIKKGFNFKLMVMSGSGDLIETPVHWLKMTHREWVKYHS